MFHVDDIDSDEFLRIKTDTRFNLVLFFGSSQLQQNVDLYFPSSLGFFTLVVRYLDGSLFYNGYSIPTDCLKKETLVAHWRKLFYLLNTIHLHSCQCHCVERMFLPITSPDLLLLHWLYSSCESLFNDFERVAFQ